MTTFTWFIPGDTTLTGAPAPGVETSLTPTPLDHVALGLSRLRLQFQDKPKIAALLTSWLNQSNEIEAAMIDVLILRCLDLATGVQLDTLGDLVGQARNGTDDDTYRRYIRARIMANNSDGTTNALIRIAQLVLGLDPNVPGQVIVRGQWDATLILEIRNIAISTVTTSQAQVLHDLLCPATSGGVRIVIEYETVPFTQTFRFDVGPGFDVGHLARGIDITGTP